MEVVMCFDTGEVCASVEVSSMIEASSEAKDMAAYGHVPVLRNKGVITHKYIKGTWVAAH